MPAQRPLDSFSRLGHKEKRFYSVGLGKDKQGRERHIALSDYNIDNGLPYRALLYLVLAGALIGLLSIIPPTCWLLGLFSPLPRFTVFPIAIAIGLTVWEPDGTPALGWLLTVARHRITPRTRCLGKPVRPRGRTTIFDPRVAITPDLSVATLPECTLRGPATVAFNQRLVMLDVNEDRTIGVARPATPDDPYGDLVVSIELDDNNALTIKAAAS